MLSSYFFISFKHIPFEKYSLFSFDSFGLSFIDSLKYSIAFENIEDLRYIRPILLYNPEQFISGCLLYAFKA